MRRSSIVLALLIAIASGTACQAEHEPPSNTNPVEPTGSLPIGGNATSGASTSSASSSSTSSGAGGAPAFEPQPADLACADELAHDLDCEACMYQQTGQFCVSEWIACGDDPYCESGFHNCTQACKPKDDACLTDCFNAKPDSLDLVLLFHGCACQKCGQLCN